MAFESLALDAVTAAHLDELVDNKIAENRVTEYKRDLYGRADADKKEALKDITGLANASGGQLIIGIAEADSLPMAVLGLAGNAEDECAWLENVCRDCIEPRITGLQIRAVPLDGQAFAIVVRVPKSWNQPHASRYAGVRRFYIRHSTSTNEASMDELRTLFTAASTLRDRIRSFRANRIREIAAGETPADVRAGGRLVIHVVPFGAFESSAQYDLGKLVRGGHRFAPPGSSGFNPVWNFEGYLAPSPQGRGYSQLHRNGIIEGVSGEQLVGPTDKPPYVLVNNLEENILRLLSSYLATLSSLGVPAPFAVFVSLQGVRGGAIIWDSYRGGPEPIIRSDDLLFREVIIDEFGTREVYARALQPVFDALWNVAGFERSPNRL